MLIFFNIITVALVWLFTFLFLFITGVRLPQQKEGISQNHSGLPKIFGRRMKNVPTFQEGIYWWVWFPFGEVDIYDIKIRTLNLVFGQIGREVAMSDGTMLQEFRISINYHIIPEKLYSITNISNSIEKFLEEITYDRVRNAILTLCNTKTDKEIEEDYHGLYALILTDINFTKRLKQLIEWGLFFPTSTEKFPSLEKDSLYIEKVNVWKNNKRDGFSSFNFKNHEFRGDEFPILSQKALNKLNITSHTKGLVNTAWEHGIEIIETNITSYKLPDNMQRLIDEKVGKILQKDAELQHANITIQLVEILTRNNPQLSKAEAMKYALLIQKTKNFSYNIMQIDGSGNGGDKISAALMKKLDQY